MKQIQLEYFIEVVEQNNFTKAAEKLFISQSALSKSIPVSYTHLFSRAVQEVFPVRPESLRKSFERPL